MRIASVGVKPTMSGYEIRDDTMISLEYLLSFAPSLFRMPRNKAGSRLTRPFVASFKLVSNRSVSRTIIRRDLAAWRDYNDIIVIH